MKVKEILQLDGTIVFFAKIIFLKKKSASYTIVEESPLEKDNFWTFFAKLRAVKKKIDDYLITSISVEKVMTKLSRPKKVSNLS